MYFSLSIILSALSIGCELKNKDTSYQQSTKAPIAPTNPNQPPDQEEKCTNCFNKRFVYYSGNITQYELDADPSYLTLKNLIPRIASAGYNGIALSLGGSGSYTSMARKPNKYFYTNVNSIIALANQYNLEIIPVGAGPEESTVIFPQLAEAFPVPSTSFTVSGNSATPITTDIMTNGGFESGSTGWTMIESLCMRIDSTVSHTGLSSIQLDSTSTNKMVRLFRQFNGLRPHTAYRMGFWMKSAAYDAPLTINIYNSDNSALIFGNYSYPLGWSTTNGLWEPDGNKLLPTQDWKYYNLDFNTGNFDTIRLYFGTWKNGTPGGKVWIDDVSITETGLSHPIRRASLPIVVSSAANGNGTRYVETTDYVVQNESLFIPPGSNITNGSTIYVSWYQSAQNVTRAWSPSANTCPEEFYLAQGMIFEKILQLLPNMKKFFMYIDEWRIMNWDPTCSHLSAAQYLERTMSKLYQKFESLNPNIEYYTWNDMFDPYHNAVQKYYMVNGDLRGSWNGLKPNTVIMNWNETNLSNQINSLKFFYERGHRQMIAAYYDDSTMTKTNQWMNALQQAEAQGVTKVDGIMYTTWRGNTGYADLEAFANLIKESYPGRWPKK